MQQVEIFKKIWLWDGLSKFMMSIVSLLWILEVTVKIQDHIFRGKIYLKIGRDVVPNVVGVLHQDRIFKNTAMKRFHGQKHGIPS